MQENNSPEEKLLNLIKNGGSSEQKASPNKPVVKDNVQDAGASPAPTKKIAVLVPKKIEAGSAFFFSMLNKILIVCVIGSLIYMGFGYLYPFKVKSNVLEGRVVTVKEEGVDAGLDQFQPMQYYADVIGKRQMFSVVEPPAAKPVGPVKPKITLSQLLAGYTFVGILFEDIPQVIVEDKKSGQSFYLTAGQMLGEIKIEKVDKGKVTVSHEDETMDMNI